MKTEVGLLFPGQGAQYVGQGKSWAEAFPECAAVFDEADRILKIPLSQICFFGPEERLQATDLAQPAIFATSVAVLAILRAKGIVSPEKTALAAGLSLGEYTALFASGSIGFEDGLRLVRLRGTLMQQASEEKASGMISVLGLSDEECRKACESVSSEGIVSVANLNSPGQVVISGENKALAAAERVCKEKGARRTIRLQVAGAFHSEVMRPAAEGLSEALRGIEIRRPQIPFLSNVSGDEMMDPDGIREALSRQLCSPVLWEKSMKTALDRGCRNFIEVSPGTVLQGLMRKIDREAVVWSFDRPEDLDQTGG